MSEWYEAQGTASIPDGERVTVHTDTHFTTPFTTTGVMVTDSEGWRGIDIGDDGIVWCRLPEYLYCEQGDIPGFIGNDWEVQE